MHIGCGMSPSFMEKMFDPFEREKNSTLSGVQGTGLGLPIVKRFVELMEGTIEAISTEGVGTEFIIKTDFLLVSRALLETTNRPSTVSVKQQIMHAKSEHQENVSADVSDLYRRKTTAGKTGENGTRVIFMTEIRR